ncbi:MAG: hypothetical protein HYW26_02740 [Candidatus Aenigmarchaeota archaeon]|nr:hypothetical protein [Candidatus Aenigmarchaeota archaeon]
MDYRLSILLAAACLLLLSFVSRGETTGNVSISTQGNISPSTGVYGYVAPGGCNSNAECYDYKCFQDFLVPSGNKTGRCDVPATTKCFHSGTGYSTGTYYCSANTSYYRCDTGGNGSWTGAFSCSSGQTCSVDSTSSSAPCSTSSPSSSSSSSGGGGTAIKKASVQLVSGIAGFEIYQEEDVNKTVIVKNNGDYVLGNVYLDIQGIPFASVLTGSSEINLSKNYNFTVSFMPKNSTEIRTYPANATVYTNFTNTTANFSFTVKVLPSNRTVSESIIPAYAEYINLSLEYEKNVTALEKEGHNLTDARAILTTIKAKMQDINQSISKKDYFSAASQISEVKVLFDELQKTISKSEKPKGTDIIIYLAVAAAILVAVILAYLLWPSKQQRRVFQGQQYSQAAVIKQ